MTKLRKVTVEKGSRDADLLELPCVKFVRGKVVMYDDRAPHYEVTAVMLDSRMMAEGCISNFALPGDMLVEHEDGKWTLENKK